MAAATRGRRRRAAKGPGHPRHSTPGAAAAARGQGPGHPRHITPGATAAARGQGPGCPRHITSGAAAVTARGHVPRPPETSTRGPVGRGAAARPTRATGGTTPRGKRWRLRRPPPRPGSRSGQRGPGSSKEKAGSGSSCWRRRRAMRL
jgi:hypothetical protein